MPKTIKASFASLHYGRRGYPVHPSSLPSFDFGPFVEAMLAHMSKLSGEFPLDPPTFINVEIIGNGYTVRFDFVDEYELDKN